MSAAAKLQPADGPRAAPTVAEAFHAWAAADDRLSRARAKLRELEQQTEQAARQLVTAAGGPKALTIGARVVYVGMIQQTPVVRVHAATPVT